MAVPTFNLIVNLGPLLITVAFYTLTERKRMGIIQRRWGPDQVGLFGSLQPIADAIKLLAKNQKTPFKVSYSIYRLAPRFGLLRSFATTILRQFNVNISLFREVSYSGLLRIVVRSLSSYSIVFGGWASNSKYALLGALRAISQRVAYELFLVFSLVNVFRLTGSFSLSDIAILQSHTVPLALLIPYAAIAFLFAIVMETNRIPFDLSEAEAELVAGYNVEYGNVYFLRFFLAEYLNRLFVSLRFVLIFGGAYFTFSSRSLRGNTVVYIIKVLTIANVLISLRAVLPRYRYDQRLVLGWKKILPATLRRFIPVVLTCKLRCGVGL